MLGTVVDTPIDECEISLCTATTKVEGPQTKYVMKQTPPAMVATNDPWGRFATLAKGGGFQNFMLMEVNKDKGVDDKSPPSSVSPSPFAAVTLGLANFLYDQKPSPENKLRPQSRQDEGNDDRSCHDSPRTGNRISGEESSIDISMPSISEGFELEIDKISYNGDGYAFPNVESGANLREKARLADEKFMAEEARLLEQKRLAKQVQMADEVRLAEMAEETKKVYVEREKQLITIAGQAKLAEAARYAEEHITSESIQMFLEKLEEEKRIAKNIRIEEEKCLEEEERRIMERRQMLERAYKEEEKRLEMETRRMEGRLLEQARLAEERHRAEQERLREISRKVEEARTKAEEAHRVLDDARILDALTFDDNPTVRDLQTLSEETSFDLQESSSDSSVEIGKCLHEEHWKEMDASTFDVRGGSYLTDGKKMPSSPNLLRLFAVDLLEVSEPIMSGFCPHPNGRIQRMLHNEKQSGITFPKEQRMPPFVFCVNMVVPGNTNYHLVMYFAVDDLEELGLAEDSFSKSSRKPFSESLKRFLFGSSDTYRNKVLKMIPRVKEGSFLMKTAVGKKPFILGKYLRQRFVQGDRYLEVIVDVSSSATTQKLLSLSAKYVSEYNVVA